jgi:hypothetical protein
MFTSERWNMSRPGTGSEIHTTHTHCTHIHRNIYTYGDSKKKEIKENLRQHGPVYCSCCTNAAMLY